MSNVIDNTGKCFGMLIAISRVCNDRWGKTRWLCLCSCGKKTTVSSNALRAGKIKSCGCVRIQHGHSIGSQKSKIYKSWDSMVQRCTNSNFRQYKDYGGRGITICERWKKFINFLRDVGKPPSKNHSIDRINNNGNYCKENCRWSTRKQQARNRRTNRFITHNGKTQCLAEWSEEVCIPVRVIHWRLKHNWSIERALTIPVGK